MGVLQETNRYEFARLGENRNNRAKEHSTTRHDLAQRPEPSEYAPFYSGYVASVPDGDIVATLEREGQAIVDRLRGLSAGAADHAYAPGKWTVREVVAHVADAERVFAYRALRFGRGDATPLPGFDQEIYVPASHARSRAFTVLVDDLEAVRAATLALFRGFEAEDWSRGGEASGAWVTVRALAWMIAGHELHHRRVLRERYDLFAA